MKNLVSCFLLVAAGVGCRVAVSVDSSHGAIGIDHEKAHRIKPQPSNFPSFLIGLNSYGSGFDRVAWSWQDDEKKRAIYIDIELSSLIVRWYYGAFMTDINNLTAVIENGGIEVASHQGGYSYEPSWRPSTYLKNIFIDAQIERNFLSSLAEDLYTFAKNEWKALTNAWQNNEGVKETLFVDVLSGTVQGSSMKSFPSLAPSASEHDDIVRSGATAVTGDFNCPGNTFKIFFSDSYSQLIVDFLDNTEKFWNWLIMRDDTPPDSFPGRKKLRATLDTPSESAVCFFKDGNTSPIWSYGSARAQLKAAIVARFASILEIADENKFKSGTVITVWRLMNNVVAMQVGPQRYEVGGAETKDKFRKDGMGAEDRNYSFDFGLDSMAQMASMKNASDFSKWLINKSSSSFGLSWAERDTALKHETSYDYDDLEEILLGTAVSSRVTDSYYKSWTHFFKTYLFEKWLHLRPFVLRFYVYYSMGHNTFKIELEDKD